MKEYLQLFTRKEYPYFIDRYLETKTLTRLKNITQFCGCDYTNLYNPLFLYTRYDHSIVVALMTWHFTHDKKETIIALLHDVGTPCFAHCIDYVLGDYLNQESSEKEIIDIIKKDNKLVSLLEEDNIMLEDFNDFTSYHILENKTPRLCTDRLDGVLHTCYIWLHTNSLDEIKEVYDNLTILKNEDGYMEIGFNNLDVALKFVKMVYRYAMELQGNRDKYVMKYISEIVKLSVERKLISLEDLYIKKESEICSIFANNFSSWEEFNKANYLTNTNDIPKDNFYISFDTKKRNVIPLVRVNNTTKRIVEISNEAKDIYESLSNYQDYKYAYIATINNLN